MTSTETPGSTLQDAFETFLSRKSKGGEGNYQRTQRSTTGNALDWLARERDVSLVEDVYDTDIAAWADHLSQRVYDTDDQFSASSAWTYYANLSAFFSWTVRAGLRAENPAEKEIVVEDAMPDRPSRSASDQQFWTEFDRKLLTRYADQRAHQAVDDHGSDAVTEVRDRAFVYVVAYTGLRSVEFLRDPTDARPGRQGLRWRALDLEESYLSVLGKSQQDEDVQLPDQVHGPLERWRRVLDPSSAVWPVFPSLHAPSLYGALRDELSEGEYNRVVDGDETPLEACRRFDIAPPALSKSGGKNLLERLCSEEHADITPGDGHEYLTLHGARRGVGEAIYRARGHAAAQRVLRHADPKTTSQMYSHIEAGELAAEATDVFENE